MATIQAQQEQIYKYSRETSICCASTTVVTLTALTIIGCAALCLTLPGVNSMSQIVYPVICPTAAVMLLAIPSWLFSTINSRRQTRLLDPLIKQLKVDFDRMLPNTLGKDRRDAIIDHALPLGQGWIDGGKLISLLKKEYPEKPADQSPQDKLSMRAYDQVLHKLIDQAGRDEWDEKITKAQQKIEAELAGQLGADPANWIIQTLKAQEDEWEDEQCIEAIRDLVDCYDAALPLPNEVTYLNEALTNLNATMYP